MAFFRLLLIASALAIIINPSVNRVAGFIKIGVNYGLLGDNLPHPADVINLYKNYQIGNLRLFDPNPEVLNALRGSQIKVALGIRNQDLPQLATSQDAVNAWFAANVQPYLNDISFSYITVGNEVIPGEFGPPVLPVMQYLQTVITNHNLSTKVSTAVAAYALGASYPPSSGAFSLDAQPQLGPVVKFLSGTGSPLMVNLYPYFVYAGDPVNVRLDYALFRATDPVVTDGQFNYTNLLDAILDAFYWAMEKEGVTNVPLVVSESGWPSAGNGGFTNPDLAGTYNRNFVKHILSNTGTPKKPNVHIDGFIFAMFNENLKPQGTEQNFGLFFPNMQPVYNVFDQIDE